MQKIISIQKAAARILEIRSQFVQTRAERFPELGLEARRKRQRQTVTSYLTGTSYRHVRRGSEIGAQLKSRPFTPSRNS